jgi:DNA modification methylase
MSITQPGDLWIIGDHKLICGNATDSATVARLMAGDRADLCFTSPPYLQQRTYIVGVGNWDELMQGTFTHLPMHHNGQVLVNLGHIHRDGEVQEYWYDWRVWMGTVGWRWFGWYMWDKLSGLPGQWNGRLAPSFEHLFHFNRMARRPNKTKAKQPSSIRHHNAKGILRNPDGSFQTACNGAASLATHKVPDDVIRVGREKAPGLARHHPAIFPVNLATEVITAYTDPGHIVYEPFSGSGTTIISAHKTGRRCRAVELQPEYCDLAIRRIQQTTGQLAIHADTKRWFEMPDWLELVTRAPVELGTGANDNGMTTDAVV